MHCAESRSRDGLAGKGERRRMGRGQCLASSTRTEGNFQDVWFWVFFLEEMEERLKTRVTEFEI